MNEIQIGILFGVMGGMMAYSFHCLSKLRQLLDRHGKHPISVFWNTSFLNYAKLSRELIREMKDQNEVAKVKAALSKADVSIVMTIVVFFTLVFLFART